MFLILFLIGSKLRLFHTVYGLSPNNFCHRTILPVNLMHRNNKWSIDIIFSGKKERAKFGVICTLNRTPCETASALNQLRTELRPSEPEIGQKIKNNEPQPRLSGSYKKKSV